MGETVLASTADGVVTMALCREYECRVTRSLTTMPGSRTSAVDPITMRMFVPYDERVARSSRSSTVSSNVQNSTPGGFGVMILPMGAILKRE